MCIPTLFVKSPSSIFHYRPLVWTSSSSHHHTTAAALGSTSQERTIFVSTASQTRQQQQQQQWQHQPCSSWCIKKWTGKLFTLLFAHACCIGSVLLLDRWRDRREQILVHIEMDHSKMFCYWWTRARRAGWMRRWNTDETFIFEMWSLIWLMIFFLQSICFGGKPFK